MHVLILIVAIVALFSLGSWGVKSGARLLSGYWETQQMLLQGKPVPLSEVAWFFKDNEEKSGHVLDLVRYARQQPATPLAAKASLTDGDINVFMCNLKVFVPIEHRSTQIATSGDSELAYMHHPDATPIPIRQILWVFDPDAIFVRDSLKRRDHLDVTETLKNAMVVADTPIMKPQP